MTKATLRDLLREINELVEHCPAALDCPVHFGGAMALPIDKDTLQVEYLFDDDGPEPFDYILIS
jgi:hypothetical protein